MLQITKTWYIIINATIKENTEHLFLREFAVGVSKYSKSVVRFLAVGVMPEGNAPYSIVTRHTVVCKLGWHHVLYIRPERFFVALGIFNL